MPTAHRRRSAPPRRPRPASADAPSAAPLSLDEALRNALRGELEASLAGLAVDLERIAARLPGRRPAPTHLLLDGLGGPALSLDRPPSPSPATAPPPRACAVIGCRRPVRNLGYCAAHDRKRRLMEATGRLPPAWVEDAAPHSLPDVLLTREHRAETEQAPPPAEEARPEASPRVWVRKKGQPLAQTSSSEEVNPAPRHSPATPQQLEDSTIMATVERWAAEFRAGKRRG